MDADGTTLPGRTRTGRIRRLLEATVGKRPKLWGAATWVLSVAAGIGALVLADFGAAPWIFVALAAWLWTWGLPTLLATLLLVWAWGDFPWTGMPPPLAGLAILVAISLSAQMGGCVLLSRFLRKGRVT